MNAQPSIKPGYRIPAKRMIKNDWQLYIMLIPVITFFIVFHYLPMYGIQTAFRDYKAVSGISGSQWVGLTHFKTFFSSYYCKRLFTNTFFLNLYDLLWGFPVPIILALLLNRVEVPRFKKFTQTAIYIPHFISEVVMAGMVYLFLSPTNGVLNKPIVALGGEAIYFMVKPEWFRTIFIGSGIWQNAGWGTIVYLAVLTGIDISIYEAATIDGATLFQKIRYIDIPSIIPIAMMLLILNSGKLLDSNTMKTLLLQTPGNIATSDIIGVYVYNAGLGSAKFSYSAAIGLCSNVINFILIMAVNAISKKASDVSIF